MSFTEEFRKSKLKLRKELSDNPIKEIDTKCPFYDKDKCTEHCNMNKMQLWENVNSQHECDDPWMCDRQNDLFYYNNDAGHYSYIVE